MGMQVRRPRAKIASVLAFCAAAALAPSAGAQALNWYRCNTHTHTDAFPRSDANGSPAVAAQWYKAHGYHCLFITDHEHLTDVTEVNRTVGADGRFLVLRGQEVTQGLVHPTARDAFRHFHVNGLNTNRVVLPMGYPDPAQAAPPGTYGRNLEALRTVTPAETYRRNLAAIRAAGGLPQINHPNMQWSVRPADLAGLDGPFLQIGRAHV